MLLIQKSLFTVTGMSCAACAAYIEKNTAKMPGVAGVHVNLLGHAMTVTHNPKEITALQIAEAVTKLGYGASPAETAAPQSKAASKKGGVERSSEWAFLIKRLIGSLIFTLPIFYLSMGGMLKWPLPKVFSDMENAPILGFTLFLLTLPVVILNRKYYISGIQSLFRRAPNMDSLIAVGSGAALVYSVFALYRILWGTIGGDMELVHTYSMNLYFESAAVILTLVTFGKMLEARAKAHTSEAVALLKNLTPSTAIALRDGKEVTIPAEEVVLGDILIVKAGGSVPADGKVVEGTALVNESAVTGESLPMEKSAGSSVTGGTINCSGYFRMKVTAVGNQTVLSKIIDLVQSASGAKAPAARLADTVSGFFVPVVMAIALLAAVVWLVLGESVEYALTTAVSVLVISCPCALGLATPAAITVGTGQGARFGILFKSPEVLEMLRKIDTVVLDKTGTLTQGKPALQDILPIEADEDELLLYAASLEEKSGHPLGIPIAERFKAKGQPFKAVSDYQLIPGMGIAGHCEGETLRGGNEKLMKQAGIDTGAWDSKVKTLSEEGKTVLFFARGTKLLGLMAVADELKQDSRTAVTELGRMGLECIMLTGDNPKTAQAIANSAGIATVIAGVLPDEKESKIRTLQECGKKVLMVGDGINDAPALARADVGMAFGAGTEIAMESAGVVLMRDRMTLAADAIKLSKSVIRNIRQNLFWAFLYNSVGIPIAAGLFVHLWGWKLDPMFAAAAMSLSSVSVVTNALRLKFWKAS